MAASTSVSVPLPLLVLYASQTGNAQDVAERIGRQARLRHFAPRVMPCDAFLPSVAELPMQPAIIFVASTTGQGEPPATMQRLWRFLLRKSLPNDSLAPVSVAVFGLGDSGYPLYNVVAKKLFRRLEALGARLALPLGLGDDQHPSGYEAALDTWLPALWTALRLRFPLPPGLTEPAPNDARTELRPKYRVTWLSGAEAEAAAAAPTPEAATQSRGWETHTAAIAAARAFDAVEAAATGLPLAATAPGQYQREQQQCISLRAASGHATTAAEHAHGGEGSGYGPQRPFFARLLANHRITAPEHFQDVRHIELDLSEGGLAYQPGDVLAIVPRQSVAAVRALCERCGWDPQAWVRIQLADSQDAPAAGAALEAQAATGAGCADGPAQPTATVQLGALLAGALDIASASPRRLLFEVLLTTATKELERERLEHLVSPAGRDELWEYNQREGRTLLEVLLDFGSATPPLEWLLQAAPRLKPRLFSIASSQAVHPGRAHLAVAVVDWVTPFKRRRRGLCSSWLASLHPGSRGNSSSGTGDEVKLPVWVERGALRLPADPAVPLIMVGPGTGVAPFRAFLQERQAQLAAGGSAPSPCVLVFGCRNESGDFYYREEWEAMQAAGVLAPPPLGLITAFSRDEPHKVYVQHRIAEHGAALWHLLTTGRAAVYVAGSADKMPSQVAAAFEALASEHGSMSTADARQWVRQLELARRYQVEAWS